MIYNTFIELLFVFLTEFELNLLTPLQIQIKMFFCL